MNHMISVIIPVYNVENYLDECIQSVIKQTYNNLELILVDDGSIDKSGCICDAYKEKDDRIRVIHKKNEGISEARNIGMALAKGEYISFLDADDFIHPQMFELLLKALNDYDADMVSCDYETFIDGEELSINIAEMPQYTFRKLEDRQDYLLNFLDGKFVHYVWKSLYKKVCLTGLCFEKGKRLEDIMFNAKLSQKLSKRVVITDKLYYYRIRSGSIMHSNPKVFLEQIDAMEYNIAHFKLCETPAFVQKYIEYTMSLILTKRVERALVGDWNEYVNKESYERFCKLYDQYGSSQRSHKIGRYFPWLYNLLKKPKVKSYLSKAS